MAHKENIRPSFGFKDQSCEPPSEVDVSVLQTHSIVPQCPRKEQNINIAPVETPQSPVKENSEQASKKKSNVKSSAARSSTLTLKAAQPFSNQRKNSLRSSTVKAGTSSGYCACKKVKSGELTRLCQECCYYTTCIDCTLVCTRCQLETLYLCKYCFRDHDPCFRGG